MQSSNYYQPNPQQYMMQPPIVDDSVTAGGGEEDDSDGSGIPDKRSGRRKIKIEYINDKSRRHITFSKRKAGIMKKAYELSTLTGTQVLLLVVSETGLVYTFTTPKLQPLVTKPEGKNLIQSCLNAPDPIESSTISSSMDHHHQQQQQQPQQQNSRSIMSSNAPTSPSTTNNNNYYRSNQNLDSINNSNNNYGDDRRVYKQEDTINKGGYGGNMSVPNPSLVLNNPTTTDQQQQLAANYSLPYTSYNTTGSTTANSTTNAANTNASLYSYNLPTQQDNSDRYWNGGNQASNSNNRQRQDKR